MVAAPGAVTTDRRQTLVATAAAVAAWVALAAIAAAVVIALVPIRNGAVQDCGTPAAFLLEGRPDVYPDANGRVARPDGTTVRLGKADLDRAFSARCGTRVGRRMVPAAALAAGGTVLGLAAATVAATSAWRHRPRQPRPPQSVEPGPDPWPAAPTGG